MKTIENSSPQAKKPKDIPFYGSKVYGASFQSFYEWLHNSQVVVVLGKDFKGTIIVPRPQAS